MPNPHPDPQATPPQPPSEELLLAAIERAARHRANAIPAVPVWAILDHLAIPRRSGPARHVRAQLNTLSAAEQLQRSRLHGMPTWELTDSGRARLRRAQRSSAPPVLPESPQHRAWRNARTVAHHEIERFRGDLHELIQSAALLLDVSPPPRSDAWFELAESLSRACRRVGSASHCLHEWAEPTDALADLDNGLEPGDAKLQPSERRQRQALRAGRRNVGLWRRDRTR
jgi:hypothetical protein